MDLIIDMVPFVDKKQLKKIFPLVITQLKVRVMRITRFIPLEFLYYCLISDYMSDWNSVYM